MQFEILGPLRIGPDRVPVRGVRDRIVLAMLLLQASVTVPMGRLAEAVWDASPPRDARNQLQGCVSRLRKQLAMAGGDGPLIITDPPGYRIAVEAGGVDLGRFRRLRDQARSAAATGRHLASGHAYRAALNLWRGPALADVDSALVRRIAAVPEEERTQAVEERIRIDLALGASGELVAELTALVEQHPYREALHGALMLALFRAGRQADARAAYRRVCQLLHDELDAEPGEDLKQLYKAIICQDPGLRAPTPTLPGTAQPRDHGRPTRRPGVCTACGRAWEATVPPPVANVDESIPPKGGRS